MKQTKTNKNKVHYQPLPTMADVFRSACHRYKDARG